MDREKAALLFDEVPDWADPDVPEDRFTLLFEHRHIHDQEWLGPIREILLGVVADQIADDDPPEVWQTAQRLLAGGLDREQVLQQLVLALGKQARTVLSGQTSFDLDAYRALLARLPVPGGADIEQALISVVRSRQPVPVDELNELTAEQLGVSPDDRLISELIDRVLDILLGSDRPLVILAGDVVVHVESFTRGVVLTHRLLAEEQETGLLTVDADLAWLLYHRELHLPGDDPDHGEVATEAESGQWEGPPGWLRGFPAQALLAVRIGADGTARLAVLDQQPADQQPADQQPAGQQPADQQPAISDELVELLRAVYDAEVEEPWLPVEAEKLVLGMLVRRPRAFAEPVAPLTELAATAGLECRDGYFAHEESVWQSERRCQRDHRVLDSLGHGEEARVAMRMLRLLDDVPSLDTVSVREVLAELHDPDVLPVVLDELIGLDDDPELLAHLAEVAERLLAVASAPRELAVAHWLAAVSAERHGDVLDAESHLRVAARADQHWSCALERLAWYEADRGAAGEALELWRRAGLAEDAYYARTISPFAAVPATRIGRNEPCWCGSGRKFKICHLGRPALPPLPDRVGWLFVKADAYLRHRRGKALADIVRHAAVNTVDPDDSESIRRAVNDPLLTDVILHEGGWFERFLADRGPLLPDDEVILAGTWTLSPRSVHEVLEVRPGDGLTLRDLGTGDHLQVRDRSSSRQVQVGQLLCTRVVPDGVAHQLVGGGFIVPPGRERALLDLLGSRDGIALLSYLVEMRRPPRLVGVDGDGLVSCRAVLQVPDPEQARRELDRRYRAEDEDDIADGSSPDAAHDAAAPYEEVSPDDAVPDGATWVWLEEISEDENRLLATLNLVGNEIIVRAYTEARMDHLLDDLRSALPGSRVTTDERHPIALDLSPEDASPGQDALPDQLPGRSPANQEIIMSIMEGHERRWCEEPVPALDGCTPREAAADPTRRGDLMRLIDSFPEIDPTDDAVGLRPVRLRELLNLSQI